MRTRRDLRLLLAVATALVVLVATASGARRATPAPPGSPALDQMALAVADLPPGAAVRRQGSVKNRDFPVYYVREFKPGASLGRGCPVARRT